VYCKNKAIHPARAVQPFFAEDCYKHHPLINGLTGEIFNTHLHCMASSASSQKGSRHFIDFTLSWYFPRVCIILITGGVCMAMFAQGCMVYR
jgi:hypothetical protein